MVKTPSGFRLQLLAAFALVFFLPTIISTDPGNAEATRSSPNRSLVVGIKAAPPFAIRRDVDKWDGISVDLWRRIAASLGYEFRFVESETVSELLAGVTSRKYDVAIGAITVTAEREQTLDFAQPYFSTGLGIAVPTENALNWGPVFRTMTSFGFLQAISSLVGLTLLTGVVVWLIERRANETFAGGARGLTSSVWWSTLAMTQRSPANIGPQTIVGRIIAILWIVASIIALAVFTASVTSILTARHLQGSINQVADLASARVGTIDQTAAAEGLARMNVAHTYFPSIADGLRAMTRGRLDAFVYDKPLLAWSIRKDHAHAVRLLETTFELQNYAFAVPIGSPLRKPISISVLDAIQSDWWTGVRFRYLGHN